ncbi:hypothetical protein M422DRAFT_29376 [Sphaerobolus stellatus SS14]|uniref:Uncharacterized protein n=1 Tax=Sphaerobolus stellatus (strain SS14) TaxID=990650 RepID=A0A0C9W4E7_SPHS4|nr:hypothetical protein M422DRAFT_29376 [Sphaerobolus stellatus SS14]
MTHTRPSSYPSSSTHLRSFYSLSNIGLDMRTVSSRTEASTFVECAPRDIVQLDIDNVEESSISLSAQLAAYGETLSLERHFNHGEPNGRRAVLVLAWPKMMSTVLRRSVNAKMRGSERKKDGGRRG